MNTTSRKRMVSGGAVALALGAAALAYGSVVSPSPVAPAALPVDPGSVAAPATVLVYVSGAVADPGLYRLSAEARVADAVAVAGGLVSGADPGHLPDMAARVHDGRQINVPFAKAGAGRSARIDINTAGVDELRAVPFMPSGLAQAIVDERTQWGPFASLSQMKTDLEVDPATMRALTPYLVARAP